jgi:hypothetical protein
MSDADNYVAAKAAQLVDRLEAEADDPEGCKKHPTLAQGVAMLLRLQIDARRARSDGRAGSSFEALARIIGWPAATTVCVVAWLLMPETRSAVVP